MQFGSWNDQSQRDSQANSIDREKDNKPKVLNIYLEVIMSIQIPTSPETNINFIYYPVELRDKAHYKENTEKCLVVLVAQLCP